MTDPSRSLNTRWSMIEELRGADAEETWRWFVDRYRAYIRSCLHRLIRSRELAEQAMDEIWSYLFTSSMLERADRSRRFRTYLAGTVRNFARCWLRARTGPTAELPGDVAGEAEDPSREYERRDLQLWTRQLVQLALAEVERRSSDQAQALRWFYGLPASADGGDGDDGQPQAASWIAARFGIKVNAVHQLVFRARNRLRRCLESELRETVRDEESYEDERRLVYESLAEDRPGLGPA